MLDGYLGADYSSMPKAALCRSLSVLMVNVEIFGLSCGEYANNFVFLSALTLHYGTSLVSLWLINLWQDNPYVRRTDLEPLDRYCTVQCCRYIHGVSSTCLLRHSFQLPYYQGQDHFLCCQLWECLWLNSLSRISHFIYQIPYETAIL